MKAYTDYPIIELGDEIGYLAPIREVEVISYDGNKYCVVSVAGITTDIKVGYLYYTPGLGKDSDPIDPRDIEDNVIRTDEKEAIILYLNHCARQIIHNSISMSTFHDWLRQIEAGWYSSLRKK